MTVKFMCDYGSNIALFCSTEELQTEQCLQVAALLTLVGVDSLITRQWYSTVDTCTDTMCSFIKSECLVQWIVTF